MPARLLVVERPGTRSGKTILLKTVALSTLLARAGLLVPAEPGSRVGFFAAVLADIGDQQSVAGDLSTFSGHLATSRQRSCALIDGGAPALVLHRRASWRARTPEHGHWQLARATAEALAERAGLAVLTTHYDSLKALADGDGRFVNAGMEYDLASLRPTFRLQLGTPGLQYALDIATRMEMPRALVDRARTLAGAASVGLETTLASLKPSARPRWRPRRAASNRIARRARRRRGAPARGRGGARAGESAGARAPLFSAKAVEAQVLRRAPPSPPSCETRSGQVNRAPPPRPARRCGRRRGRGARPPPGAAARAGAIRSRRDPRAHRRRARLRAVDGRRGRRRARPTRAGGSRSPSGSLTLEPRRGRAAQGLGRRGSPRRRLARRARPKLGPLDELTIAIQNANNTLDLRGQRADEALRAVESFLDRAALGGVSPVIIVHGHGTGALRKRVRAYLAGAAYVARWAPGSSRQGGDGVSIVELR